MAYGLFELAQRRAAGYKPSMVIVRFDSEPPKCQWWKFSDITPEVVIQPDDRISADELFPLSGLPLLMAADAITEQVQDTVIAAQQVAHCLTFVCEAIDGGGFSWHRHYGEKLLGERYAVAA